MQSYSQCINICPLFDDSQPTSPPCCTEHLLKSLQLLKIKANKFLKCKSRTQLPKVSLQKKSPRINHSPGLCRTELCSGCAQIWGSFTGLQTQQAFLSIFTLNSIMLAQYCTSELAATLSNKYFFQGNAVLNISTYCLYLKHTGHIKRLYDLTLSSILYSDKLPQYPLAWQPARISKELKILKSQQHFSVSMH